MPSGLCLQLPVYLRVPFASHTSKCWGVEPVRVEGCGQGAARKAHKLGSLLCSSADSAGLVLTGPLLGKQGCFPGLHSCNLAEVCQLPRVTTSRSSHVPDRPPDSRVSATLFRQQALWTFLMTQKNAAVGLVSCLFVLLLLFFRSSIPGPSETEQLNEK